MQAGVTSADLEVIEDPEVAELQKGEPKMGENLMERQRAELTKLVDEFKGVFNERPGEAKGIEHQIKPPRESIVQNQWRWLPHHLWQVMEQEIRQMQQLGVIEESHSPWRSPLVIVRKQDGS